MASKLPRTSGDEGRARALARARFRAWWQGTEVDEEAVIAAYEAEKAKAPPKPAKPGKPGRQGAKASGARRIDAGEDDDLFADEAVRDPRLEALQRLWGGGRIAPGDDGEEALFPAQLGIPASAVLAVIGSGLAAPLFALANGHPGELRALEWREESVAALKADVEKRGLSRRISVTRIDLETFSAPAEVYDGMIVFDAISFADNAARVAQQIARGLKPRAAALIEAYCGLPGADLAPAFATAFAEPHIRMNGDLGDMFDAAGLRVDSDDDVSAEHLEQARLRFRGLAGALADIDGLNPRVAQELAWEAESWRERMALLARGRIERRRFKVIRRAD